MATAADVQSEQTRAWNGVKGRAWVDGQPLLDRVFQPFEALLTDDIAPQERVLDVGCGTGAVTRAAARRVGPAGSATGIDISQPMIEAARQRAEAEPVAAHFLCADAASHAFSPGSIDRVVSRFGVMFFADPVPAFANLRQACRADAALRCAVWRSPADNPFMTVAERAAAPFLPTLPVAPPGAPGQFAFADADRVRGILNQSGWRDVTLEKLDVPCAFPLAGLDLYLTRLGPLGQILHEADEPTRERIVATARAAFQPYIEGEEVRFRAACWQLTARA